MKSDAHWEKIGLHSHHGICVPLFSLRTKKSCGIGEFSDLILLIDWCKSLKLDCIQLLPINDTGPDSSPYNPLSSCALDPVYLSLVDLGVDGLDELRALNERSHLRKQEVLTKKLELLRKHFSATFSNEGPYQQFVQQNPWVHTYALFKALKEQFEGKNWSEWPSQYPKPDQAKIDFYIFLQFHCFEQMEKIRAHATSQGVFIQGDVPILLSPDSADVWAERDLFRLDLSAGAPPDYYNPHGQGWGFPLFQWDEMRRTHFSWWHRRLQVAERLFHIYRIDHVVGFFRIWAIPNGKKPTEGSFVPQDRSVWAVQGKELLEMMLKATTMLPIAEDLGTIPSEVYPVLKDLGICGTKVMRWQRSWNTDKSYIPFNQYEPFSMTTVSTPDMYPLEAWWQRAPAESIPFAEFMHWSYHPILSAKQRLEILHAAHHTSSFFHINLLQEYLALFPEFVYPNPEEERINWPGTTLPTNWTYRLRPFLEEIVVHKGLAEALTKILV